MITFLKNYKNFQTVLKSIFQDSLVKMHQSTTQ